jgi:hypothetical protein
VTDWARGRAWYLRAPLLLWFAWIFKQHLADPFYSSLFGGLNLGIHELGHYLFAPFGELMAVAGGSLLQCVVPLIGAWMFYRQRDYFAVAIAFCWLSTNLYSVAAYAADARTQQLELVSPGGGEPIHDWHYLLGALGWFRHDRIIGRGLSLLAIMAMVCGLGGGVYVLRKMLRHSLKTEESPTV